MTRVVHCKKSEYDVYIGRPSIFGNPFVIGKDGDRATVIQKHFDWAVEKMKQDPTFREAVKSLKGKVLGCWCRPQ
jgi:hypothetical protein